MGLDHDDLSSQTGQLERGAALLQEWVLAVDSLPEPLQGGMEVSIMRIFSLSTRIFPARER
jgi:hypothetical protein